MFSWSERSRRNLSGVHPDLVAVCDRALEITTQDMMVIEGVRSKARQKKLVARGKSQTMHSRHLTGHAVDIVPYPVSWDLHKFYPIADAMIEAAQELEVPLRWGGNWRVRDLRGWNGSAEELSKAYKGSFIDGPHFEIPRGAHGYT
jgi:peptidoglycan L-alanyl-D-glutamate endopeptidase CwlK